MAKPIVNGQPDGKTADGLLRQADEQRVADLLDELYALEQFRRDQLALRKLGAFLKSARTREEIYLAVERFAPLLWPQASGGFYVAQPANGPLERVAAWGDALVTGISLNAGDCWAVRQARPHYVQAGDAALRCPHAESVQSPALCVPILASGHMSGVLTLQGLPARPKGTETLIEHPAADLALAVGEELGFALSHLRLQESLREQVIRDPLTGLFNRQFFEELVVREMARAERKTQQLSVLVLDIDHFKRINDTFGHSAGDMVLRHIGPVLQAHVRESDVACRIGGEEFLLLLSELALPLAVERAEAIRKALRELSLRFGDKVLTPITASFGAAAYPHHGRTVDALFRAADQALLDAKREGRDRVVAARLPS